MVSSLVISFPDIVILFTTVGLICFFIKDNLFRLLSCVKDASYVSLKILLLINNLLISIR